MKQVPKTSNWLEDGSVMDVYRNKSRYKVFLIFTAAIIGMISLGYTQFLVKKLEDRERKLIDLYAKALEYLANASLDENVNFISSEIIEANVSIPVILTDENGKPLSSNSSRNISFPSKASEEQKIEILKDELEIMAEENEPIPVEAFGVTQLIYYRNSDLIYQLRWYPYIQLSVIGLIALGGYMVFNISRRSEQNRVWVGLAKETAHQLGTPLSSLIAWVEYFKTKDNLKDEPAIAEIEKDIERLEMVTKRFSNIGSIPVMKSEDVLEAVESIVGYLQKRISSRIKIEIKNELQGRVEAKLNRELFQWVLENTIKNSVDSMDGKGHISIHLSGPENNQIIMDISDDGKGISKSKIKEVFKPGFTSKKRGWGLGLTLSQRIIEQYHQGRIFVKNSAPGKGTTFRIILSL